MGMMIEDKVVAFSGVIYEDVVVPLRDFMQESVPDPVTFDLTECQDLHLAVLQEILAYQKLYECSYRFGGERRVYQQLIDGFDGVEDHCS